MIQEIVIFSASLILALGLTPLIRVLATRYGYVSRPIEDRWHRTPTALLGGVAIFLAYMLPLSFFLMVQPDLWVLLLGAGLIFAVGLIDDCIHLKPYSKLVGQIVASCVLIANGMLLAPSTLPILGVFLTLMWIVGVTNAFNLLDNMDGLSAGTACIGALCLFLAGTITGNSLMTMAAAALCGATLGFLWFNFHPARIFMGDSGSLFLGFTLSTLAITGRWEHVTHVFFAMLIPVLVLAVPIFDTTFVSLMRFFNGRPISEGGKDHSSHRLVAFGLPEKTTVLLFYTMSMTCGVIALLGLQFGWLYPSILTILIVIVFWYFGVFLSGIVAYGENASSFIKGSRNVVLDLFLMEKKRLAEVLIDCVLIALSFTLAFTVRFDGLPSYYLGVVAQSLPILIPLKLMIFFYFGLYRGLWRYVGIQDLINIVKAVTLSALLSVVVVTMVFRFEGYSRAVFIIDWMVLLLSVSGVRLAIRVFKEYLGAWVDSGGKRLLIVGAGDAGEIALREIKNNSTLGYFPLGFIDDDLQKLGRKIHGVPILGTRQELHSFVKKYAIEEILVAIPSAEPVKFAHIVSDCRKTGVSVQVMPCTMELTRLTHSQSTKGQSKIEQNKVYEIGIR